MNTDSRHCWLRLLEQSALQFNSKHGNSTRGRGIGKAPIWPRGDTSIWMVDWKWEEANLLLFQKWQAKNYREVTRETQDVFLQPMDTTWNEWWWTSQIVTTGDREEGRICFIQLCIAENMYMQENQEGPVWRVSKLKKEKKVNFWVSFQAYQEPEAFQIDICEQCLSLVNQ